jgi:hypothetical protein
MAKVVIKLKHTQIKRCRRARALLHIVLIKSEKDLMPMSS